MSEIIEFWEDHFEYSNVSNVIPKKDTVEFFIAIYGGEIGYQFFNITT